MKHTNRSSAGRLLRGASLFLVAAAAPALMAQDASWSKGYIGVHLGYRQPLGELADNVRGTLYFAGFYEKVWSSGFGIRGTADAAFGMGMLEKDSASSSGGLLNQLGLSVDLAYYFGSFYPFVGAGFLKNSLGDEGDESFKAAFDQEKLDRNTAYHAGVGILLGASFGIEAKYIQSGYNCVQVSMVFKM
jgi:hypothetical protein